MRTAVEWSVVARLHDCVEEEIALEKRTATCSEHREDRARGEGEGGELKTIIPKPSLKLILKISTLEMCKPGTRSVEEDVVLQEILAALGLQSAMLARPAPGNRRKTAFRRARTRSPRCQ